MMMMMRRVMMMAPPVMLPSRLFAAKWTVRRWRKGSLPSYCNFLDSNFGKCFDFFTRPQLLDDWLTHFVTQQLFWSELRRGDAATSWQSTLWDHPRSTQDLSGPDVSPQPPTPDHVTKLMGDQTDQKDWRSNRTRPCYGRSAGVHGADLFDCGWGKGKNPRGGAKTRVNQLIIWTLPCNCLLYFNWLKSTLMPRRFW